MVVPSSVGTKLPRWLLLALRRLDRTAPADCGRRAVRLFVAFVFFFFLVFFFCFDITGLRRSTFSVSYSLPIILSFSEMVRPAPPVAARGRLR